MISKEYNRVLPGKGFEPSRSHENGILDPCRSFRQAIILHPGKFNGKARTCQ